MAISPQLEPVPFATLPGWADDDLAPAYSAFRRSALQSAIRPYRLGSLGIVPSAAAESEARTRAVADGTTARDFFERHFIACRIAAPDGLVTGFYEPVVAASPIRTAQYQVPLLARPDDLVAIDDGNRPAGLDPYLAFGRATADGIVEYHDRRAIEGGALDGRTLAIAWLESRVDAFFIHVQGAARLVFPDGGERRITYAAKSGQRFTGPGRLLVEAGEITQDRISMQAIRDWLAAHPDRADELLWQNRSYIFFREAPVDDPALGPIAAAKVPLTPGRSLAVDRLLHTFGTPLFVVAPGLTAFGGTDFRRLMIAQDTGSAIVGAARGDLFAGSGTAAGTIAGGIRAKAEFYALVPRAAITEGAR